MKPIIQFHRGLVSLAVSSLILVLASASIASAQVHNTKTGVSALASITTGDENTADGFSALQFTNTGSRNTAVGSLALQKNTLGTTNTAVGYAALAVNTGANGNTALGTRALTKNTNGAENTATGVNAMQANTRGAFNTANGHSALASNTTGTENTATGYHALMSNTLGTQNTAVGTNALVSSTGNYNTALGARAGTDPNIGSNNIYIGDPGFAGDNNVIAIGGIAASGTSYENTYIGGIYGTSVNSGTALPVYVDTDGHLGTATTSSARFKEAIKPMDRASEAILALQPVTFRYKHELDPNNIPQFGLVAEQVETVNPDLVIRDGKGKIISVRYDAVNAMLLNEFLKEHQKVQDLEKQVAALTTGLQKVTARIEAANSAPRVVGDN
jgi:hypothetical protein